MAPPRAGTSIRRAVVFSGLAGSGKTTASRGYAARLNLPTMGIKLEAGKPHGWSALRPALAALGLAPARPAAVLDRITTPTLVIIEHLEHGLNADGTFDAAVGRWLPRLLTHPWLHVMLVSRTRPSDPLLTNILASGHGHLVDTDALAFTPDEVQTLWRLRHGTCLDAASSEHLVQRTGGLAAAVHLACVTGQIDTLEQHSLYQELPGSVWRAVPTHFQELLVATAVFERLSATRLAAVTGNSDSTALVEQLARDGMIQHGSVGRVHPLLHRVASGQLQRDSARFRAVTVLGVEHTLETLEFDTAWTLARAAEHWDLARTVILRAAPFLRRAGTSHTIIGWIDSVPSAMRDHELSVLLARCQSDVGDLDGAELTLTTLRAGTSEPHQRQDATVWLAAIKQGRGDMRSAAALVTPYLDDATLPPLTQARIFRIDGVAKTHAGEHEAALQALQRSIAAAQAAGEVRLLALAYNDLATIAGRLGRYAEAEHALRLAERCWRDVGSIADLAGPLNNRAMLFLAQQRYDAAFNAAQQSRAHALAADRLRDAAVASATCGDIAFAQRQFAEAEQHYGVAAEDAERSGYFGLRAYAWAMQAHLARLQQNRALASEVLPKLQHTAVESVEHAGWQHSGLVAAQLTLGLPPSLPLLQRALELVGDEMEDVRTAIVITLAHAERHVGNTAAAAVWADRATRAAHGVGVQSSRLAPLVAPEPPCPPPSEVQRSSADQIPSPIAPLRVVLPVSPTTRYAPRARLHMQLSGANEGMWWQGQPVRIPALGLDLLILLLTAATPVHVEHIRARLWPDAGTTEHALRKLVSRIHAVMPQVVQRSHEHYAVTLARAEIDIDLLTFLELDIQATPTSRLLELADTASAGWLLRHTAVWVNELRERAAWRLALIWLEIGRRYEAEQRDLAAADAFERAQGADPCSDFVSRAVIQHAQRHGDRTLVVQRFRRHQAALDASMGIEPAHDLQAYYREALEP